jgi:Macrocin-O-methyltransferase (TylF)
MPATPDSRTASHQGDTPTALYLDLLKRSLTNTLFAEEPDAAEGSTPRYVEAAISHYQQGPAVSMLPLARFDNLQQCITTVLADQVDGDLVETGVWRGGATIFMRAALKAAQVSNRKVWCADSFEGLPEPDPVKFPLEHKAWISAAMTKYYDRLAVSLEEVKRNFAAYGMLDDQVRFLKGWFKDTLPTAPIEKIAVLRLDGDYYESTRTALEGLYDRVSPGGFVIIDDYGEDSWTYCRKAVDEFRAERGISAPLIQVDKPCSFWRKGSA